MAIIRPSLPNSSSTSPTDRTSPNVDDCCSSCLRLWLLFYYHSSSFCLGCRLYILIPLSFCGNHSHTYRFPTDCATHTIFYDADIHKPFSNSSFTLSPPKKWISSYGTYTRVWSSFLNFIYKLMNTSDGYLHSTYTITYILWTLFSYPLPQTLLFI